MIRSHSSPEIDAPRGQAHASARMSSPSPLEPKVNLPAPGGGDGIEPTVERSGTVGNPDAAGRQPPEGATESVEQCGPPESSVTPSGAG